MKSVQDPLSPDKHWQEVMDIAEKHGFIIQAYGGVATLATHEVQLKELGKDKYKEIQNMNNTDSQMALF